MSERRQVKGRSKPFHLLLEDHKKRRELKKLNKLRVEAGLSQMSGQSSHGLVRFWGLVVVDM